MSNLHMSLIDIMPNKTLHSMLNIKDPVATTIPFDVVGYVLLFDTKWWLVCKKNLQTCTDVLCKIYRIVNKQHGELGLAYQYIALVRSLLV